MELAKFRENLGKLSDLFVVSGAPLSTYALIEYADDTMPHIFKIEHIIPTAVVDTMTILVTPIVDNNGPDCISFYIDANGVPKCTVIWSARKSNFHAEMTLASFELNSQ